MRDNDKSELQNMVNNIAKTCEELTSDPRPYEDLEEEEKEAYDNDEPGSKGVGAYLDDCYDIKYTIDSRGDFQGVRVMVACGGPNIWIDTNTGQVEGAWWLTHATKGLSNDAMRVIDDYFEEIYECCVRH